MLKRGSQLKLFLVLCMILVSLALYIWFGVLGSENTRQESQRNLISKQDLRFLRSINILTSDAEISMELRDGLWFVTRPQEYPANQEYVVKSLQVMQEAFSEQTFKLDQDRYGFEPGRAFIHLIFDNGLQKRLKVGSVDGPANTLYVLDQDSKDIFVYHNVWGQFLYYPTSRFLNPYLPLPGQMVKNVTLQQGHQIHWKVFPVQGNRLEIRLGEHSHFVEKAKALWFFKKIREFQLNNLKFETPSPFQSYWQLYFETDKGNIRFDFDEKMEKIFISDFNVFAEVAPYSLKSLSYELEKVIQSDKK